MINAPPPEPVGGGLPVLPVRDFIELARYASGTYVAPPVWMTHTPPGHLGGVHGYLMAGQPRTNAPTVPEVSEAEVRPVLQENGCVIEGRLPTSFFNTRHNPYRFLGSG